MVCLFAGICFPQDIMDLFPDLETRQPLALGSLMQLDRSKMRSKDAGRSMKVMKLRVKTGSDVDEGIAVDYEQEVKGSAPTNLPIVSLLSSSSAPEDSDVDDPRHQWWTHAKHIRSQCVRCCRGKRTDERWNPADDDSNENVDVGDRPGSVIDETIANNVLRHVQRMANPVWSKQSRSVLLDIKQSHPAAFQDVCLYSEVCRMLGSNTYRLGSRRFLQELFLDLDFLGSGKPTAPGDLPNVLDGKQEQQRQYLAYLTISKALNTPLQIQTQNLPPSTIAGKAPPLPAGGVAFLLRSPPLASVHEASVENLDEMASTPKQQQEQPSVRDPPRQPQPGPPGDEEAIVRLREPASTTSSMPPPPSVHRPRSIGGQSCASVGASANVRPRFNTLELDLSCSRNKFPIRDRSKLDYSPTTPPTAPYGSAVQGPAGFALPLSASSSSASFVSTGSASAVTSPTQWHPSVASTFGSLYCEQRLRLKTSKSEATLTKNK
uniref:Uncharacterized protein n=1 Tax=Anopheles maculatus TaxID=74869 RepID=A0A182S799_9DIPT